MINTTDLKRSNNVASDSPVEYLKLRLKVKQGSTVQVHNFITQAVLLARKIL